MGVAEYVFVTWGSNKGVVLDAMSRLEDEGIKAAMVHFTHLWPLDGPKIKEILSFNPESLKTPRGSVLLIEQNSHAQFGQLLKMATGIDIEHKLLKYDGRQIFVEDV